MIITIRGFVVSNEDARASGRFTAIFEEISDDPIEVIHTSPGYRLNGGGFFFVPEIDDEILANYDTTNNQAYYNSTIINAYTDEVRSRPIPNFQEVPDANTYNYMDRPVKVTYQNQKGSGLCITSDYTSYEHIESFKLPPRIVDSVVLKTPQNKRISLDDSPKKDSIFIQNQHADGILISGDSTDIFAARMIQAKSSGPQYYTCMQSHMGLRVVDGTDITIENNSTGAYAASTLPQEKWPNGSSSQAPKSWGGIYLKSDNGDLSLVSKADDGRVFINTPTSQIQIVDGNIVINTIGELSIDSLGDINMKSGGNINIDAGGDLNLNSGGSLKGTGSTDVAISTTGTATIEGTAALQLNPGGAPTAGSATTKQSLKNDYND